MCRGKRERWPRSGRCVTLVMFHLTHGDSEHYLRNTQSRAQLVVYGLPTQPRGTHDSLKIGQYDQYMYIDMYRLPRCRKVDTKHCQTKEEDQCRQDSIKLVACSFQNQNCHPKLPCLTTQAMEMEKSICTLYLNYHFPVYPRSN